MQSNLSVKKVFLKFISMLLVASSLAYASSNEAFMESANALFNEEKVFQVESKRLLDNTNQVDKAFVNLNTILLAEHRTTQALINLDNALTTIEKMLVIAEQVPQTREQALQLKKNIEAIHKPVAKAAKTMSAIDAKVVPLLKATQKTEKVIARLIVVEDGFRNMSLKYFDTLGLVAQCEHDSGIINIMDNSRLVYSNIDTEMKKINDTYDNIKRIPEKSLHEIVVQLEKIVPLEVPVVKLHDTLEPLYHVLNDLEHILNKRIGVKPGYPCGADICHKNQSYPCGVKTCKKYGVPYTCGVKTCTEKISYPCGVKTCHVDIGMSVSDVIKGSAAIENKIESMLSSTAYAALKQIGLGSIIHDLENQANTLLKPVLSKLHLNIDTNLPSLDIDFDLKLIDVAIADVEKFEAELIKLGQMLDMHSPTFEPYTEKLNNISQEIKTTLNSPICKNIKH
jgi:uncharacterized coiled-coil DUF342 family protein